MSFVKNRNNRVYEKLTIFHCLLAVQEHGIGIVVRLCTIYTEALRVFLVHRRILNLSVVFSIFGGHHAFRI